MKTLDVARFLLTVILFGSITAATCHLLLETPSAFSKKHELRLEVLLMFSLGTCVFCMVAFLLIVFWST